MVKYLIKGLPVIHTTTKSKHLGAGARKNRNALCYLLLLAALGKIQVQEGDEL